MVDKTAIWAIAMKDMRSVVSSVRVWLPMLVIPFLLGVVAPCLMIILVGFGNYKEMENLQIVMDMIEKLKDTVLYEDIQSYSTLNQKMVYVLVTYLFTPFFLVIPIMTSSVVAANSFVGEKERKTLESLLLSPIDMLSLFIGKVLSAFIPAMVITLIMFFLFGLSVTILTLPLFAEPIFPTVDWIIMISWVVPSVCLFVILFNVVISAKVRGFQEAYQLGSVVVIPIVILIISQLFGYFFLNTWRIFFMGLIVLILNGIFIRWISHRNHRLKLAEKHL